MDTNDYKYITKTFLSQITEILKNLFKKLNSNDINILSIYTAYIIDHIFECYNFEKENIYYKHFLKNNGQDIKSLCLQLIPFVKNFNFSNLNQILYNDNKNNIDKDILKENINNVIKTKFKYSNFALGLIDENKDIILDIENNDYRLIENIIYENFVALKETITVTNGKLYVNWLNVFPLYDYEKSSLFKKSMNEIDNLSKNIDNIENIDNYGLWFGDYYNVIRNGYYESIKKIKWVIYNKDLGNKRYYYIQYLTKLFNMKLLFKYNSYDDLDNDNKIIFENKLNLIKNNFKLNTPTYQNINFEKDLFKNILTFLINNSKERFLLEQKYFIKFKLDIENVTDDLDKNEINLNKITDNDLIIAINNILPKVLWNYLHQVITDLKSSIYGTYLINNENINNNFFFFPIKDSDGEINLKNIYNISKILSHNDDFILLGTNFKNLKLESKIIFFKKFFNLRINLRNNIIYQEQDNKNIDFSNIRNNIINGWNKINYYLVWNYLSYNGLLSEFKVMLELTDNSLLPSNTKEKRKHIQYKLKKYFDKNKDIFKSNYYLTNDNYFNLNKYINSNKNNYYYNSLTKNLVHYTFYGNDYISQLNIFNHYIHHQIIYVTGGTGTGKSTQVPKLLMYCLKMYDYNNNGKTICTQPRISPTEGNAKRIADELGVNIVVDGLKTDNYYLQYKDQKDKHLKESCEHLMLRFVTDGTLLEELVNNPYLKEQIKTKKINYKNDNYVYGFNNKYDIVIVDEAHEHNTNMDLILTLMKQTCFLNNSIRLVIISATMDDDEPIYRSYFKYINDNLVYPIKQEVFGEDIVNSYYLDRRLDISIPGQTTQYTIDEYYVDLKLTGNNKLDSINAQKESYKYIVDICNKFDKGEILLFSTGKAEIKDAVNQLNKILPSGNIALPFYSEMNTKYREIIENIGTKIRFIRNKRLKIAEEWGSEFLDVKDVPEYTYKRAIIVATNVAEASITIDTLKFVVDTGYQKVSIYDDSLMTNTIQIEKISEASRLQRKGRVGRTSNGTVYYMYKKGGRELIKPKYNINNDDFHLSYIKLLNSSTVFEQTIIDSIIINEASPYAVASFVNNFKVLPNNNIFIKSYFYNKNLYSIYEKQYLNEGDVNIVKYFTMPQFYGADDEEFDNDYIIPHYLNRLVSGYKNDTLMDKYGKLYIIHPFEKFITRNINNDIIKFNNINQSYIDIDIFDSIFANMKFKLELLNFNIKSDNLEYFDGRKTIYGEKIQEVSRIVNNITESNSINLLLATGYNIQLEMIMIISMLDTINGSILSLAGFNKKNNKIQEYDNFIKKFKSKSDIISIYKIVKLFYGYLNEMNIFKIYKSWLNNGNIINIFKNNYYSKVKIYKSIFNRYGFTIDKNIIPKELVNEWNLFNELKINGILENNKGFINYIYSSNIFKEYILDDYKKYNSKIKKICDDNYLNFHKITNYFENLFVYIKAIITSERDMEKDFNEISPLLWVDSLSNQLITSLYENSDDSSSDSIIEEKLLNCFLFSNPLNIMIKINNKYKSINGNKEIVLRRIFQNYDSCCYIGNFCHYYSIRKTDNIEVSIINNIDPKKLALLFPFHYNEKNIKNIYTYKKYGEYKNIVINDTNWELFINKIINNHTFNNFPLNASRDILPIISEYISKIK
jgi:hypothetical protein